MSGSGEFKNFQGVFDLDRMPLSNGVQYKIFNRRFYSNWCKMFCRPCLYRKIRKENANLEVTPTDFSIVDKYVLSYGKQLSTFTNRPDAYISYEVHLPIKLESYTKVSNQQQEELRVQAPYDDRFEYCAGDLVTFKINDFMFDYKVDQEPQSYAGILYILDLKYVQKYKLTDNIQYTSEPDRRDEEECW